MKDSYNHSKLAGSGLGAFQNGYEARDLSNNNRQSSLNGHYYGQHNQNSNQHQASSLSLIHA